MKRLRVVRNSKNSKIGECAATYRPVGITCPQDCALLDAECYAQRGLVNMIQLKSEPYDQEHEELVGTDYVRHLVSGDAFKDDKLDKDYVSSLLRFHWMHPETQGWGYTHRCQDWDDAGLGPEVHPPNLTILASVDSLPDARRAWKAGWFTARVIDSAADKHPSEVLCPFDVAVVSKAKPKINCISCKKCWEQNNIAFLKTGPRKDAR